MLIHLLCAYYVHLLCALNDYLSRFILRLSMPQCSMFDFKYFNSILSSQIFVFETNLKNIFYL